MQQPEAIPVIFYKEDGSGNEPVRKWLASLSKGDKKAIGDDLLTVQKGWPLGMPLVDHLGDGLWEVRSRIRDGIARIIFIFDQGEMVLLHGFVKKTKKTPNEELDLATKRAKKYKHNEGS